MKVPKHYEFKPMTEISARELWLYKNPQALKDVQEGIKIYSRGSFAKYVKDDI